MSFRLASYVAIPVVLAAGGLAFLGVQRTPDATAVLAQTVATPAAAGVGMLDPENTELPPNHPPIGGGASLHESPQPVASEPPAIAWKVPAGWQEETSPNGMRLATYRTPSGAEIAVSRAGGTPEANIRRWISQFNDAGRDGRVEKTVGGLHAIIVDVAGTYVGGGMAMGAPSEAHPNWAMVGAIVETPGLPYFFKMTGPAAAVRAARSTFDGLLDGIAPM